MAAQLAKPDLSLASFFRKARTVGHCLAVPLCVRNLSKKFDQPGTFLSGRSARRVPFHPANPEFNFTKTSRSDGVAPYCPVAPRRLGGTPRKA
jgi:hypothetical protein